MDIQRRLDTGAIILVMLARPILQKVDSQGVR